MNPHLRGHVAAFFCCVLLAASASSGQTADKYSARLGMVPAANGTQQVLVSGKGAATATLATIANRRVSGNLIFGLTTDDDMRCA